jgi:hypothetical protein
MNVSRLVPHVIRTNSPAVGSGGGSAKTSPARTRTDFAQTLASRLDSGAKAGAFVIAPQGTPNNLLKAGELLDMGGGVYYNTGNATYQDLGGSIVGTNPAAVQQYTDPKTYLASGAAYQPSDAALRESMSNLDDLVPPGCGSPTFILNARWAYERTWGGPPITLSGSPAWSHQATPVPLAAFPGVLKAPGPPPLAGTIPAPWGDGTKTQSAAATNSGSQKQIVQS